MALRELPRRLSRLENGDPVVRQQRSCRDAPPAPSHVDDGGVAGIVTLEDIVEEVFGDIYDEHDTEQAPIRTLSDTMWLVEGVVTISDLEDELETELEDDEDYETVAGLLMKAAGSVPRKGFIHETQGYSFEVLKTDATHILEIAVRKLPEAEPSDELDASETEEPAAA